MSVALFEILIAWGSLQAVIAPEPGYASHFCAFDTLSRQWPSRVLRDQPTLHPPACGKKGGSRNLATCGGRFRQHSRGQPQKAMLVHRLRGGKGAWFGRKNTHNSTIIDAGDLAKDWEAGMLQWRQEAALPVHYVKSGGLSSHVENIALCFADNGMLWRIPHTRSGQSAYVDSEDEPCTYLYTPYGMITSFDLQFERTLADRVHVPLVRLTVESQHPARMIHIQASAEHHPALQQQNQIQLKDLRRPGRLIASWIGLQEAARLEERMVDTQHMESVYGHHITMVLPSWVQLLHNVLPTGMYSPGLRKNVETLIVYWMSLSFLWALWQLYHHLELFAAAVRPFVRLMMSVFGRFLRRVDDVLDSWTAKYIHWMKPIDVLIYRIRTSGLLSTSFFKSFASFFSTLHLPSIQLPSLPYVSSLITKVSAAWASVHLPVPTWMAQNTKQMVQSMHYVVQPFAAATWSAYANMLKQFKHFVAPSLKAISSLVERKDALNPVGLTRVARQNTILIVRAGAGLKRRIGLNSPPP